MSRTPGPWWTLILAGLLPAVAGAAAAVLYDSPLLMLGVLLAASAAGVVPVVLSRSRPGSAGPAAVLTLLVLIGVLLLTLNGGAAPVDAAGELTGALARLLSFTPPIPTRVDTLTPAVVVVWAAAFAAAALADRGWRLLAAAPAVVVLIAGLLLVGRSAPVPGWVAPAVALGAALLTLGERPHGGRGRGRAGLGFVLTAVAAALVITVGVLTSWVFSDADRVDAATRYQPPVERPQPVDPLTRLAGWAKGDPEVLARVQVAAGPPATAPPAGGDEVSTTAWRWAVLDDFDGSRWTTSVPYRPTGERLRAIGPTPAAGGTGLLSAAVQVSSTLTPWLPVPGPVRRVTGGDVAVNPDHDSLVRVSPAGDTFGYSVVADPAGLDPQNSVDRATIATLRAGTPPTGANALAAPALPAELEKIADGFAPTAGKPDGERALGLQDLLSQGAFVPDAPPGHLYVRLKQFFNDNDTRAYLRGTSEQFATAFAVLARTVGLPTRVVVGFEVPAGGPTDAEISGPDMKAWPEVYFAGPGWVRFAPTPKDVGARAQRNPPKLKDLVPQQPQAAEPVPAEAAGGPTNPDDPAERTDPGRSVAAVVVSVAGGGLLIVLLGLLILLGLRLSLRARRRRGPDPSIRAIGAWRELEDALLLSGAPAATGSATAVADLVRRRTGPEPGGASAGLTELARIANAAAFAPAGTVAGPEADRAWQISDQAQRDLRRSTARGRRWRWWIGLAPLRRERRRR